MFHSSHLGGGHLGADPAPSPAGEAPAPAALPATIPAPTAKATSILAIGVIAVITYLVICSLKGEKASTDE